MPTKHTLRGAACGLCTWLLLALAQPALAQQLPVPHQRGLMELVREG